MGKDVGISNPNSFVAGRAALLEDLEKGRGRELADRTNGWVRGAMYGRENEFYRYYPKDAHDKPIRLETDLVTIAKWIADEGEAAGIYDAEARFALRKIWEFLIQSFAVREAWGVGKLFKKRNEGFLQRVQRSIGYLFPRLAIAVQVGYFVELGSTDLQKLLKRMAGESTVGYALLLLFLAFVVGTLKVEQRLGYEALRRVAPQSMKLFSVGLAHAALGFGMHWFLKSRLGYTWDPRFALIAGSAALYLGFIFQLVWQDRPIGAPA